VLTAAALLQIVLTTIVCTGVMTVVALIVLRLGVVRRIANRSAVAVAAALASVAASTIMIAAQMYLSDHDAAVLVWVLCVSGVLSLAAGWFVTTRAVRTGASVLGSATERVGAGDVVTAVPTGLREFDDLSAQLADASTRLAEARATIDELDAARRQFFAWISHDLRTPLAGMRAMAEAIESGSAPDVVEYAGLLRSRVDAVNGMVDDLFELSKLQSGTIDLHPEAVELLDLVSDAVADVRALAATRGITIEQDGVEGRLVWADPAELTRAIGNLLANGIRHAPPDSAVVVRADTVDDDRLVLSVIDQGPGVTAEDLGRMFDVGWRGDASRSSGAHGGAGLGLAIVRGIVEAHGGTVAAARTARGFSLDLTLPVAPVARG
jgi:signal transduction histidine kinase